MDQSSRQKRSRWQTTYQQVEDERTDTTKSRRPGIVETESKASQGSTHGPNPAMETANPKPDGDQSDQIASPVLPSDESDVSILSPTFAAACRFDRELPFQKPKPAHPRFDPNDPLQVRLRSSALLESSSDSERDSADPPSPCLSDLLSDYESEGCNDISGSSGRFLRQKV